jgi:CheY-like chemotaxis protein
MHGSCRPRPGGISPPLNTRLLMPLSDPTASPVSPAALIVDDDETLRKLLGLALSRYGFRIHHAAEGREAITVFERHRTEIDVVVLDVRMPGCGGPETLCELRRLRPGIPVVFVTGYMGDLAEEELLAQGATRIFYKPFPLIEFAEYVRGLVKRV